VTGALSRPSLDGLFAHWTFEPVALVLAVALSGWYLLTVRRVGGWPVRYCAGFALGIAALIWTTCGPPQVYASSLFWMWTTQVLVLWFAVPLLLLSGRPLHLAQRRYGEPVTRVLRSRPIRVLANPLVSPALVPIGSEQLSAEVEAMRSIGRQSMLQMIEDLSPEQQQVLTLKFVFNFGNGEVASILGKTEGAVKSLQHRALASLQKQIV